MGFSLPLLYSFLDLFLALFLLASFASLGMRLQRSIFIEPSLLLRALVGAATGISVFVLLMFALGSFGLMKSGLIIVLLAANIPFLWSELIIPLRRAVKIQNVKSIFSGWRNETSFFKIVLAVICLTAVFSFLFCYAPPTQMDEVNYQLALPKIFAQEGKLVSTPDNLCSYYPLNAQLLYTGVLLLGTAMSVKALVWVLGIALLFFIWGISRNLLKFDRLASALGLLFYTAPFFISYQGVTNSEFLAVYFLLATVVLFYRWKDSGQISVLVLAGLFAGLALGTRNYAVGWIPALAILIFFQKKKIKPSLLFLATAGVVFSIWPLRNLILTGNPLYPQEFLKGTLYDPYFSLHTNYLTAPGMMRLILSLPGILSYGGLINGFGVVPLSLMAWAFLTSPIKPLRHFMFIFAFNTLVLIAVLPFINTRYFGQVYPLVTMVAAHGAQNLFHLYPGKIALLLKAWILVLVVVPGVLMGAYWGAKRIPFFLGRQTEESYLSKEYEALVDYAMIKYVEAHVEPGSKMLMMFFLPANYYFYPSYEIVAVNRYPPETFQGPSESLANRLKNDGVTYVLVPKKEIDQSNGTWTMTVIGLPLRKLAPDFFNKIHETPLAALYELRSL